MQRIHYYSQCIVSVIMVIEIIYIVLISYYVNVYATTYNVTYNQDVINDFIGVRKAKHVDLYIKWI